MACVASKKSGVRVPYEGNYGQDYCIIQPIPETPPLVQDKWSHEWYILGEVDETFYRVALPLKEGETKIQALGPMRKDYFPDFVLK